MQRYDGKTAIVTGSASGIGLAIVERIVAEGARVVANDISPERLQVFADNPSVITLAGDMSDPETTRQLMNAVDGIAGGRIDALFNNAAITIYKPALDYTLDDWNRNIAVNLSAYFLLSQAVGRRMVQQRSGAILNTSSVAGEHGILDNVAYVSAKHGVIGLTRSLAVEWARYGVRVNALCPGFTDTPLALEFKAQSPQNYAARASRCPMGRAGTPAESAAMAAFLNSDECSFTTGQVAYTDGGGHALYSGYQAPPVPQD